MCGIFGLIIKPKTNYPEKDIEKLIRKLAVFSESRGKDSSGISFRISGLASIDVIKGDVPVRTLLKSDEFKDLSGKSINAFKQGDGFSSFGHARLVTNGSQLQEVNNQPVIKEGILIIHNGIVTNVDQLWSQNPDIKREYLIDTEIIPALLRKNLKQSRNLTDAVVNSLSPIEGTFSIAAMFNDLEQFVLATNNGSLYYLTDNQTYLFFASESHFLEKLIKEPSFNSFPKVSDIKKLNPGKGLIIGMDSLAIEHFVLVKNKQNINKQVLPPEQALDPDSAVSSREFNQKVIKKSSSQAFQINKKLLVNKTSNIEVIIDPLNYITRSSEIHLFDLLENNFEAILKLKRCCNCLLPETFPFIEFDESGTCNYCKNYKLKNQHKSIDHLKELAESYKTGKDSKANCIVPFSGGRDSTYTLHIVKKVLGLNPIAFTYDWGMVTDLARRNAARVCGKLGVENIIVAADIRKKRRNIQKNVKAWLKKPDLGMVPLFMAGDKYFFYYSNKIQLQNNIELSIWGSNPLENTDFKLGFAGIPPHFAKKRIDEVKVLNKIRLASFFGGNYIKNPSYFNDSLIDTFGSFISRYLIKRHGYLQLFDFVQWNEDKVESVILNEYNWEKSIDTNSTWRIGDGTAAFYNYIYYTVAGFSEYDTFRSNQIREGQMTREKGLELINLENRPRYENLRWYLDIIGLDFKSTIEQINKIPKLYNKYL